MGNTERRYYGKYRGIVTNTDDPLQMGRLMALVPDIHTGLPLTWAMPCVPFAGPQTGMYCMPPIGAGVWVEFEQGDIGYPIWVGAWWGSGVDVPRLKLGAPPIASSIIIQTSAQNSLTLSDAPGVMGGITLKTAAGAMILINDSGITISNGKGASIILNEGIVNINDGEMVIT